jgi:hypothetical protein
MHEQAAAIFQDEEPDHSTVTDHTWR